MTTALHEQMTAARKHAVAILDAGDGAVIDTGPVRIRHTIVGQFAVHETTIGGWRAIDLYLRGSRIFSASWRAAQSPSGAKRTECCLWGDPTWLPTFLRLRAVPSEAV